jgi:hypothetical protein
LEALPLDAARFMNGHVGDLCDAAKTTEHENNFALDALIVGEETNGRSTP